MAVNSDGGRVPSRRADKVETTPTNSRHVQAVLIGDELALPHFASLRLPFLPSLHFIPAHSYIHALQSSPLPLSGDPGN